MRYKIITRYKAMTPQLLAKYINLHKRDVSKSEQGYCRTHTRTNTRFSVF